MKKTKGMLRKIKHSLKRVTKNTEKKKAPKTAKKTAKKIAIKTAKRIIPRGKHSAAGVTATKKKIRAVARKPSLPEKKLEKEIKKTVVSRKVPIEVVVGESKFYTPPAVHHEEKISYPQRAPAVELPMGYAQDRMVLQVRDPWWIHTYWEVATSTWERFQRDHPGILTGNFKKVLRVYDISNMTFTGDNAHSYFDIEVTHEANNWYIDTQGPGRSWCVDYGLLFADNRFVTILRSNTVTTPLDGPSWIIDEEWMIPEDMFARLYGLGIGTGSSPLKLKKLWKERLKGDISSGGLFSASPIKKQKARGFWLVVNTELIVYGQTQPDAKVTFAGQPVTLRPDGSFSFRFFLPDGKQIMPVKATSSDGRQERTITPIVTKETQ